MENNSLKLENDLLDSLIRIERDKNALVNKKDNLKSKAKKSSLSKVDQEDKKRCLFIILLLMFRGQSLALINF